MAFILFLHKGTAVWTWLAPGPKSWDSGMCHYIQFFFKMTFWMFVQPLRSQILVILKNSFCPDIYQKKSNHSKFAVKYWASQWPSLKTEFLSL